jgi:hypothetical protein
VANLDQLRAGIAHRLVVPDAVLAVDDNLGLDAIEVVRDPRHQRRVFTGDAGRGRQAEPGRSAIADVGSLVVCQRGEPCADRLDQGADVHERLGGVRHRLRDLWRHDRAAEAGVSRGAIDDPLHSELAIDIGHAETSGSRIDVVRCGI